mmetsp:Transcript_26060/g.34199  ORF Transcript_26060/g.34199 Transcript_26060/m.34199 type:complete len:332 (-) Transcript_26060:169-1164(-)
MAYNIEGYIVFSWIGGLVLFLANLILLLLIDPPKFEMDLVKRLNISCKPLVLFLVLLQLPLFYIAANLGTPIIDAKTSYTGGDGDSWNYGWGRPLTALGFLGVGGLFITSHWVFRILTILGLMQDIILNTVSAVDLDNWISCINTSKCVATTGYNYEWYTELRTRDCGTMFLEIWLLLLVVTISLANGFFSARYSYRQLSTGDANRMEVMRKEIRRFKLQRALKKSKSKKKELDPENPQNKMNKAARKTSKSDSRSFHEGKDKASDTPIDVENQSLLQETSLKQRKQSRNKSMQAIVLKGESGKSMSGRKKSARVVPTAEEEGYPEVKGEG